MRVRLKSTGQTGTIPDDKYDPSLFDQVEQPKPQAPLAMKTTQPASELDVSGAIQTQSTPPPQPQNQNPSIEGFVGNATADAGNIIKGIIHIPESMKALQDAYGNPNELLIKDPKKYVEIMTSPIRGTLKEYGDLLSDPLGTAYNKPVTTALNVLQAIQLANMLKPNAAAKSAGDAMKGVKATSEKAPKLSPAEKLQKEIIDTASSVGERGIKRTVSGKTIQQNLNVTPAEAKRLKIDLIKSTEEMAKHGMSGKTIEEMSSIAETATGSEGIFPKVVRSVIGDRNVNISNVLDDTRNVLKTSGGSLSKSEKSMVLDFVKNNVARAEGPAGELINGQDAFDVLREAEIQMMNYKNVTTPAGQQLYSAFKQIKNSLDDAIYESTKDVSIVEQIKTPEVIKAIKDNISPYAAEQFQKARTVSDFRHIQKPFVDLSKLVTNAEVKGAKGAGIGNIAARTGATIAGGAAGGPIGAAAGNLVATATEPFISGIAQTLQARGSGAIANVIDKAPEIANVGKAGVAVEQALRNSQNADGFPATATPAPANNSDGIQIDSAIMPAVGAANGKRETTQEETQPSNVTGHSMAEHLAAMSKAKLSGDKEGYSAIKTQYDIEKAYQDELQKNKPKATNPTEARYKFLASSGMRGIEESIKMLNEDPNLLAKRLIPGQPLSRKYENAAMRAAESLLRIKTGAVANKEEVENYAKTYMPWVGDDRSTVAYKLNQLAMDYMDLKAVYDAKGTETEDAAPPPEDQFAGMFAQ